MKIASAAMLHSLIELDMKCGIRNARMDAQVKSSCMVLLYEHSFHANSLQFNAYCELLNYMGINLHIRHIFKTNRVSCTVKSYCSDKARKDCICTARLKAEATAVFA